jgi:hypothetical protein
MSDTKIDHSKKHPKYACYHVRQGKNGEKGFWTRIGVAWAHKDGNGVDIQLDSLVPLDSRITCRIPETKDNA